MSHHRTLTQLIARYRGVDDSKEFSSFELSDNQPLLEIARDILTKIPPSFGSCAILSAVWAARLRDDYKMPAMAVAGDLKINKTRVFKCKRNIPVPKGNAVLQLQWDGHCWVEIDKYICDLSIFRTAYAINRPSVLKDYIINQFGQGRGALISPFVELKSNGMEYVPKYVLTETQLNSLIRGIDAHIKQFT